MANIEIEIAGRKYSVSCRDGEEEHLRSVATLADKRARDAAEALGSLTETRHLMFTALLLADDVKDLQSNERPADRSAGSAIGPELAEALEVLADRVESLAHQVAAPQALEQSRSNT